MDRKIKVITLADNPMFFSGIGTQTKYFCEALIESGKFSIFSIGGQARPIPDGEQKIYKINDDWEIFPNQGYGNRELLQSIIRRVKPDILWFMTDPRFWEWLWLQDREIRPFLPIVYYHVWDNYPAPKYNKSFYESNDVIINMSKITQKMVEEVSPDVYSEYLPLSINTDIFKRLPEEQVDNFINQHIPHVKNKFVIFWNNRNGYRKLPVTLLYWYKEFCDKVGHDKVVMLMNTLPNDEQGSNLEAATEELELINGEVLFSPDQVSVEELVNFYNFADVVINISHSEGFGLGTLEASACEVPIIVNKTGGLSEQILDGINGFGLEPKVKVVVGGGQTPYIYQDYCAKEDFLEALEKIYNMSKEQRREMGRAGRKHVLENYNFKKFCDKWVNIMENVYNRCGSWETRKNYRPYDIIKF